MHNFIPAEVDTGKLNLYLFKCDVINELIGPR
jgi:hypothetical protein